MKPRAERAAEGQKSFAGSCSDLPSRLLPAHSRFSTQHALDHEDTAAQHGHPKSAVGKGSGEAELEPSLPPTQVPGSSTMQP